MADGKDDRDGKDDKDDLESDARAAERLTFFSDAVIAIAITLLAIELPLPEGHSVHAFWHSVQDDAGHYAAFLIGFVAIAAAWNSHHDIFRYVRRVDTRVRTLNTTWLRPVHPGLLRHVLRVGALVRRPDSAWPAAPGLHAPARGPRRARHLTRTLVTARPRPGWLARTVTGPGSPGRERIQTAPAPPAAAKSNGLSPTRMAGPSTSSVTWPDT